MYNHIILNNILKYIKSKDFYENIICNDKTNVFKLKKILNIFYYKNINYFNKNIYQIIHQIYDNHQFYKIWIKNLNKNRFIDFLQYHKLNFYETTTLDFYKFIYNHLNSLNLNSYYNIPFVKKIYFTLTDNRVEILNEILYNQNPSKNFIHKILNKSYGYFYKNMNISLLYISEYYEILINYFHSKKHDEWYNKKYNYLCNLIFHLFLKCILLAENCNYIDSIHELIVKYNIKKEVNMEKYKYLYKNGKFYDKKLSENSNYESSNIDFIRLNNLYKSKYEINFLDILFDNYIEYFNFDMNHIKYLHKETILPLAFSYKSYNKTIKKYNKIIYKCLNNNFRIIRDSKKKLILIKWIRNRFGEEYCSYHNNNVNEDGLYLFFRNVFTEEIRLYINDLDYFNYMMKYHLNDIISLKNIRFESNYFDYIATNNILPILYSDNFNKNEFQPDSFIELIYFNSIICNNEIIYERIKNLELYNHKLDHTLYIKIFTYFFTEHSFLFFGDKHFDTFIEFMYNKGVNIDTDCINFAILTGNFKLLKLLYPLYKKLDKDFDINNLKMASLIPKVCIFLFVLKVGNLESKIDREIIENLKNNNEKPNSQKILEKLKLDGINIDF